MGKSSGSRVPGADLWSDQRPAIKQEALYLLLREGEIQGFNERIAAGERCDLTMADLRGLDLRKLEYIGADFTNSAFRGGDLRGLDLRSCTLAGANIMGANANGTYFPLNLAPSELHASLVYGIRMNTTQAESSVDFGERSMSTTPIISSDPLYLLLREGHIEKFNSLRAQGEKVDLRGCDLRGLDLRTLNANDLDLTNTYLRNADMRGVDLRKCTLAGASLGDAKISGAYFPAQLEMDEILLSVRFGTRIRSWES